MSLLRGGFGSVALPEEITMYCPQCKTKASDKGQCLVELAKIPDENSKTGFIVQLQVDCRNCNCYGKEPAIDF